jgi:hypothetical protein
MRDRMVHNKRTAETPEKPLQRMWSPFRTSRLLTPICCWLAASVVSSFSLSLSRNGNGPGRQVKHQSCAPTHPSKLHIRHVRSIPLCLKILARPTCGPSFYGPTPPDQTRFALQFHDSQLFCYTQRCRNTVTFIKILFTNPVNPETIINWEREKIETRIDQSWYDTNWIYIFSISSHPSIYSLSKSLPKLSKCH